VKIIEVNPQCDKCANQTSGWTCKAFPDRIPEAIWLNMHDHRTPYKGDGGVRFKPIGGKD